MPPYSALALLPFATAIGIWVSWSDMKFMKIPNKAVMAMVAVWLIVGVLAVPFQLWLWGWALGAAVLAIGFIANALRMVGAGDAKFAAAMAPVFVHAEWRVVLPLFAACLIGAFAAHRLARMIPVVRNATTDWISWTHRDFPMGLALSGTLIFYLSALVWPLL
jgi:prepilin peptidase CpaA